MRARVFASRSSFLMPAETNAFPKYLLRFRIRLARRGISSMHAHTQIFAATLSFSRLYPFPYIFTTLTPHRRQTTNLGFFCFMQIIYPLFFSIWSLPSYMPRLRSAIHSFSPFTLSMPELALLSLLSDVFHVHALEKRNRQRNDNIHIGTKYFFTGGVAK